MKDTFRGDTSHLISSIEALLSLDADGALVPHGIGGHARDLLSAAAVRLSTPLASHAGAEPKARYSFVCNAGCGVCAVKVAPFEYERTETIEGEHLGSKYQPQIVSSCCGSEVHVYDNEADHWGAEVTLAAPGAAIAAREQEAIDRAAWAKMAAKAHGWTDDSTPPMVDGRFETGWHESEFQTFMQGVRHGRS